MTTEREMVSEMVADLTKARQTLREQLAGVENQLFILTKLGERMDAAAEPEAAPDPLEALGLSSGVDSEIPHEDGRASLTEEEVESLTGAGG